MLFKVVDETNPFRGQIISFWYSKATSPRSTQERLDGSVTECAVSALSDQLGHKNVIVWAVAVSCIVER